MNNYELLDETLNTLNEGKILDKIKRVINNVINKNLKNDNKQRKAPTTAPEDIEYTLEPANSKFDYLYNKEAMCAEGLAKCDSDETASFFVNYISKWEGCPKKINFYYCKGKDLNSYYHLTGDNKYPDDLGIFFIDWSNFGKSFSPSEHKGSFRWFSDVVDNNARREIRKGNTYYKDYHSLYGDDWFYSTVDHL